MCRSPEIPVFLNCFSVSVNSQFTADTKKQSLKFNSQLFCTSGCLLCLVDIFLFLRTLDFFWWYLEALRSLFLSIAKPDMNLNMAVSSPAALSLSWTRTHAIGRWRDQGGNPRNMVKLSEKMLGRSRESRTLGRGRDLPAWGGVSVPIKWAAESRVWASLVPTASADS